MERIKTLKAKLLTGTPIFGIFTRLVDPDAVEALAASALDFVVLDAEHGSLARSDINRIVAIARAHDMPVIVRVSGYHQSEIHHAIAVGASGVIIPHIADGEAAQKAADFVASACLERAYAGMGRAADYRRPTWETFKDEARRQLVTIAQIDEKEGAEKAEEIARASDIDAVFVGSLSLALSLGIPLTSAVELDKTIAKICGACVNAGRRVGVHISKADTLPRWTAAGVNLFVVGNDINLLRQGADRLVGQFRNG